MTHLTFDNAWGCRLMPQPRIQSSVKTFLIQNTADSLTSPPFVQSPPHLIPDHMTSSSLPRGNVWGDLMSLCGNMSGMEPPTLCLPPTSLTDNALLSSSTLAATWTSNDVTQFNVRYALDFHFHLSDVLFWQERSSERPAKVLGIFSVVVNAILSRSV